MGVAFLATSLGVAVRGLRDDFDDHLVVTKEKRAIAAALGRAGFLTRLSCLR
jgi:hypothetical protein